MILEFVTRMSVNSFVLKTVAITLLAGLLAYMGPCRAPLALWHSEERSLLAFFSLLDAQYLHIGMPSRERYDDLRFAGL
jgi:hypothetical protein